PFMEWVTRCGDVDEGFEGLAHREVLECSVGVRQAVAPPAPEQGIDCKRGAIREHAAEHNEGVVFNSLEDVGDLRVPRAVVAYLLVEANVVDGGARCADRRVDERVN